MTDTDDEPVYADDFEYDEAHPEQQDDEPVTPDDRPDDTPEPPD
jgi:hypothetical protein